MPIIKNATVSPSPRQLTGSVTREFRSNQVLFHEGDKPSSFFIITQGTVSIQKRKDDSHVELARIYQNEVLGELSFFDREPRSATATAVTEVKVLEIQFSALDKIYSDVPDYMKTIMASMAGRLRKANETIRRLQNKFIPNEETGTNLAEPDSAEAVMQSAGEADAALAGTHDDSEPKS